jgi:hypothetical protein
MAQYNDAGIWLSAKADQRLYERWEFSAELATRMDQNFTGISSMFTDLSAEYEVAKPLDVSATYRLGLTPDDEGYFMHRQRWAFDATAGEKFGDIKVSYRLRYQAANRGVSSFEGTRTYDVAYRNKLGLTWDINKKWDIDGSVEFWTEREDVNWLVSDLRVKVGFDHRLKKRRYISGGIIHQRHISGVDAREYIVYFGYSYSLKRIRKKDDTSLPDDE